MKIAFFGTPDFTTDFLDTLTQSGYTLSLIVTGPDRPVGRGMVMQSPKPKLWGDTHTIPVLQPEKITPDFIEDLAKKHFDLFVVVAYGKILPETLIHTPTFGTINVHYSLLPKYRGATPVESAILAGDTTTGVCIQQMAYKLDTGAILAQRELAILPGDTTHTLRARLNTEACNMIPELLSQIFNKIAQPKMQDENLATHTKKIKKEDGEISLDEDPIILNRKNRAYDGWPGLYFYAKKQEQSIRVKITEAHLENGAFIIDNVIPENGKKISFADFTAQLDQQQ